jgi:hypothetical protein
MPDVRCQYCGDAFPGDDDLGRHIRGRHAEQISDAAAAAQAYLTAAESDSVSCAACGERFDGAQDLAAHRQREHGGLRESA